MREKPRRETHEKVERTPASELNLMIRIPILPKLIVVQKSQPSLGLTFLICEMVRQIS